MNVEVAMLTGDSQAVAQAVAADLGIDQVFAEVLPEHKDQMVAQLQSQGKRVAMVGDGVNDAPALTRANVGIAIGGGTDVAIESAGLILVQSNPLDVVKIFALSRASYRKMIQNLWWAGYNIIAHLGGRCPTLNILISSPRRPSMSVSISGKYRKLLRRTRLSAGWFAPAQLRDAYPADALTRFREVVGSCRIPGKATMTNTIRPGLWQTSPQGAVCNSNTRPHLLLFAVWRLLKASPRSMSSGWSACHGCRWAALLHDRPARSPGIRPPHRSPHHSRYIPALSSAGSPLGTIRCSDGDAEVFASPYRERRRPPRSGCPDLDGTDAHADDQTRC
jgi:hypothetical protein